MTDDRTAAPTRDSTISVPGVGRVAVQPDLAGVRVGSLVVRPTAGAAREAAASAMTTVLEALAATGIAPRDVRTAFVGLDAVRDYSSGGEGRITGYQATNAVEATVRDVNAVGRAIDAALEAGATSLDGLHFRLADPSPVEDEARRLAIADARRRATTIAAEAGLELGPIVAVHEGPDGTGPGPRPYGAAKVMEMAAADTPVEAGSQEVVVTVRVTFAIA